MKRKQEIRDAGCFASCYTKNDTAAGRNEQEKGRIVMTEEEYQAAVQYWIKKDAAGKHLNGTDLREAIEEYLRHNNTCALATGSGDYVRCTPVEYSWQDGAFWIFTEGGMKFAGLAGNKNVSLAVFDTYSGFGKIRGLQVQGEAEIIEPFCGEYLKAAAFRKIPEEALRKLPSPMHLLKIVPGEFTFLNSVFQRDGYGSRQTLKL